MNNLQLVSDMPASFQGIDNNRISDIFDVKYYADVEEIQSIDRALKEDLGLMR